MFLFFLEKSKVSMFRANNPADEQQLFETPPPVTRAVLKIAQEYGHVVKDAHFLDPFAGNGLMTAVFDEMGIAYTAQDKFTMTPAVDFYEYSNVHSQVTCIVTNPPFRGIAKFFHIMAQNGKYYNFFIY